MQRLKEIGVKCEVKERWKIFGKSLVQVDLTFFGESIWDVWLNDKFKEVTVSRYGTDPQHTLFKAACALPPFYRDKL